MKKTVLFILLLFAVANVYATRMGYFGLNLNENTIIAVGFHHYRHYGNNDDNAVFINSPNGLFWDLLVWAKNAHDSLSNVNNSIYILIDFNSIRLYSGIDEIKLDLDDRYFTFNDIIELKNNIIIILNTFYNIGIINGDINYLDLYAIKGRDGSRIYSYNNKISALYSIYFSDKDARQYISNNNSSNIYVENIILRRENINDIVAMEYD